MVKTVSVILITLLVLVSVSACTSVPEPEYASAIAEQMLQAINQENYAQFTQYFDEDILKIMPEKDFQGIVSEVKARAGSYQSKEFLKAENTGLVTIVYYAARFTEEPEDVFVEIRFKEVGEKIYITSFNLDSPKLSGN